MAKKTNPKAAAKLTVDHMGSVDKAVESFEAARRHADVADDKDVADLYTQCIAEAQKLR